MQNRDFSDKNYDMFLYITVSGGAYSVKNESIPGQFSFIFPIGHALRDQLSRTYYLVILKVDDSKTRVFYVEECTEADWSTRRLERHMNNFLFQGMLAGHDDQINRVRKSSLIKESASLIGLPIISCLGVVEIKNMLNRRL